MAFGLCGRLVHVGQKWAVLPAPCLAVLKILSLPVAIEENMRVAQLNLWIRDYHA